MSRKPARRGPAPAAPRRRSAAPPPPLADADRIIVRLDAALRAAVEAEAARRRAAPGEADAATVSAVMRDGARALVVPLAGPLGPVPLRSLIDAVAVAYARRPRCARPGCDADVAARSVPGHGGAARRRLVCAMHLSPGVVAVALAAHEAHRAAAAPCEAAGCAAAATHVEGLNPGEPPWWCVAHAPPDVQRAFVVVSVAVALEPLELTPDPARYGLQGVAPASPGGNLLGRGPRPAFVPG